MGLGLRRFIIPEIALGFLFATALWVAVLLLITDPQTYHQICEYDQNATEHCTPHNLLYVIGWYVSYAVNAGTITAVATAAIAWFTLTLKRSTDKLWAAGERQLEVIQDNAAQQSADTKASISAAQKLATAAQKSAEVAIAAMGSDRAWLTIDPIDTIDAENGVRDGVPFRRAAGFQMNWRNRGRSPAVSVEIVAASKIVPWEDTQPPPFSFTWPENPPSSSPIGPDARAHGLVQGAVDDEIEALISKKSAFITRWPRPNDHRKAAN